MTREEYFKALKNYIFEYMYFNRGIGVASGPFPQSTFIPSSMVKMGISRLMFLKDYTPENERFLKNWMDDLAEYKPQYMKEVKAEQDRIMEEIKDWERKHPGRMQRVRTQYNDYEDYDFN